MTYVIHIRPAFLVPMVLLVCMVGAFAVRNSLFDVGLALVFGLLGFAMRQFGYPLVPLLLAQILGPIVEENFLRALDLGNNEMGYFFGSTIAVVLWVMLLGLVAFNIVRGLWRRQ